MPSARIFLTFGVGIMSFLGVDASLTGRSLGPARCRVERRDGSSGGQQTSLTLARMVRLLARRGVARRRPRPSLPPPLRDLLPGTTIPARYGKGRDPFFLACVKSPPSDCGLCD